VRKFRVTLVAFFVALPIVAAAQTPQWVVRDQAGEVVGPVLSAFPGQTGPYKLTNDSTVWIARRHHREWLLLRVSEKAVWATTHHLPFLYETPDCSGPAFLAAPRRKNEALATVVFDTEVYWPAGRGESRVIRSKGFLVRDPDECQDALGESALCCSTLGDEETHLAAEVSRTELADLHLRPPFHLAPIMGSSK
jgi:hypothetical protein